MTRSHAYQLLAGDLQRTQTMLNQAHQELEVPVIRGRWRRSLPRPALHFLSMAEHDFFSFLVRTSASSFC